MGFNRDKINLVVSPRYSSGLNYRSMPTTKSTVLHTSAFGYGGGHTSGEYEKKQDGTWWQVVLNKNGKEAWVRDDVTKLTKPTKNIVTEKDGENVLNGLIENDKKIFEQLAVSAPIISDLEKKGLNVDNQKIKFKLLSDRLEKRQEKVKDSKIVNYKEGIKKGYEKFARYYNSVAFTNPMLPWLPFSINGVGIGVALTTIIISAVAGVGLSIAAYFVFKPDYDESKVDLEESKALKNALDKLDPETAQKIRAQLEKQIDDAYNRGLTGGTFLGMGKLLKPILIVGAGLFAGNLVIKYLPKPKKQSNE